MAFDQLICFFVYLTEFDFLHSGDIKLILSI